MQYKTSNNLTSTIESEKDKDGGLLLHSEVKMESLT